MNAGRREDSRVHGEVRDPLGASEPPRTGERSVLTHRSRAHWTGAAELWAAPRRFPSRALRGHPQPRIPGTWGQWLREGWDVDADLLNRTFLRASFIRGNSVTFSYKRHPSVYSLLFWDDGFWVCVGDVIPHRRSFLLQSLFPGPFPIPLEPSSAQASCAPTHFLPSSAQPVVRFLYSIYSHGSASPRDPCSRVPVMLAAVPRLQHVPSPLGPSGVFPLGQLSRSGYLFTLP